MKPNEQKILKDIIEKRKMSYEQFIIVIDMFKPSSEAQSWWVRGFLLSPETMKAWWGNELRCQQCSAPILTEDGCDDEDCRSDMPYLYNFIFHGRNILELPSNEEILQYYDRNRV
jgi:hypothetical protein